MIANIIVNILVKEINQLLIMLFMYIIQKLMKGVV